MLAGSARGPPFQEEGWIAVERECNVGDCGEVDLCSSHRCLFCDVVRNGLQQVRCPGGLTVFSSPARASKSPGTVQPARMARVLLFVQIVYSTDLQIPEATRQQITFHGPEMRQNTTMVRESFIMMARRNF